MDYLKIKYAQLFMSGNIQIINPELKKLIEFPAKHAGLKYDISAKLGKAVQKALEEFEKLRTEKLIELAIKKKVLVKGAKEPVETQSTIIEATDKTPDAELIIEINGEKVKEKKMLGNSFDLGEKMEGFTKYLNELVDTEIELNCYPIKLSKLEQEADCSSLSFIALDAFIKDDRE